MLCRCRLGAEARAGRRGAVCRPEEQRGAGDAAARCARRARADCAAGSAQPLLRRTAGGAPARGSGLAAAPAAARREGGRSSC